MTRFVDRGAVTAAYVGIGMAVTIAISFLLVIPIDGIVWLLALPAGLLIGYYANQRSNRKAGPWSRILRNGLFAAVVTGLSMAVLVLLIKAIFFFADTGYPDFNRVDAGTPIPPYCDTGASCVYERYVARGSTEAFVAAGVTDAATFTPVYWSWQGTFAGSILLLTTIGGLGGALLYGVSRPRPSVPNERQDRVEPTPA